MHTKYIEKYTTLGFKIAYYRKKASMTQEVLAEQAGISLNFLAKIEGPSTAVGMTLDTLFAIADALKVAPSKLLEED